MFEVILNLMAPYPFLNGSKYIEVVEAYDTTIEYEVNIIMLFLSFNRLYLSAKFFIYMTSLMSPRSQRVC